MNAPCDVLVADLRTVSAADLEVLWQHEMRFWRDRLLWDATGALAALRRVVQRGGLPGKVVRVHERTVGYTYYGIAGGLGVIGGLVILPDWRHSGVGETLLKHTIQEIRRQRVWRIESRFVSVDCPWLGATLESEGFHIYRREFLRCDLRPSPPMLVPTMVSLVPWQPTSVDQAAMILQAAYAGGLESELLMQYRTVDGCRAVLDQVFNQGGCGYFIPEASALAHQWGHSIGLVIVTEVAPRQGHLPQIAVLPEYQRQGIGRALLHYSLQRLVEGGFDTFSLIVSRANDRALKLYREAGFQAVLTFPVGVWER